MELTSPLHSLKKAAGRYQVLMALLLFSLPLGQQSLTNLILLVLFIHSLVFYRWRNWKEGFGDPLWYWSALFYAYLFSSLLWSENVAGGLLQLETKMSFFLAPLFIIAGRSYWDSAGRRRALQFFWWGCIVAVLVALAYASWRSLEAGAFYETNQFGRRYFFAYTHLALPLMHPGYLATYLALGMFSAVELQYQLSSKVWLWTYRLSILLFLVFMVMLQARINLLALFAVIGLAALYLAWKRKAWLWLSLPLIPVLAVSLFLGLASDDLQKRYFQFPNFSYDISGTEFNSATYRLAEWKCAADVIESNFWWGTGIGDKNEALMESYERNKFWLGLEKQFNAHNQYLETFMAGGLPAVLLLLTVLFYYLWRASRQLDYLAMSGMVFLIICLLTESMLERMWGVLICTMIFPLLLLKTRESD